jgi:hypothetical protein
MKTLSFLAILPLFAAVQARADGLPLATYEFSISHGGCTIVAASLCNGLTPPSQDTVGHTELGTSLFGNTFNFAGTNVNYTLSMSGSAVDLTVVDIPANGISVSGFTYGGSTFDIDAALLYDAEVVPKVGIVPPPGLQVPVLVNAQGRVSCDSSGPRSLSSVTAFFFLSASTFSNIFPAQCDTVGTIETASYSTGSLTSLFPVETPVSVELVVNTSFGTSYVNPLFAGESLLSGTADPIFQIDPSFPLANDFELEFSPNLVSAPAVPEPSTLTLLGAGLVGLAAFLRRKSLA